MRTFAKLLSYQACVFSSIYALSPPLRVSTPRNPAGLLPGQGFVRRWPEMLPSKSSTRRALPPPPAFALFGGQVHASQAVLPSSVAPVALCGGPPAPAALLCAGDAWTMPGKTLTKMPKAQPQQTGPIVMYSILTTVLWEDSKAPILQKSK